MTKEGYPHKKDAATVRLGRAIAIEGLLWEYGHAGSGADTEFVARVLSALEIPGRSAAGSRADSEASEAGQAEVQKWRTASPRAACRISRASTRYCGEA